MIRKGKSKYQGILESVDSSCDITISYQTTYYKNQTVSTYNTNLFYKALENSPCFQKNEDEVVPCQPSTLSWHDSRYNTWNKQ